MLVCSLNENLAKKLYCFNNFVHNSLRLKVNSYNKVIYDQKL